MGPFPGAERFGKFHRTTLGFSDDQKFARRKKIGQGEKNFGAERRRRRRNSVGDGGNDRRRTDSAADANGRQRDEGEVSNGSGARNRAQVQLCDQADVARRHATFARRRKRRARRRDRRHLDRRSTSPGRSPQSVRARPSQLQPPAQNPRPRRPARAQHGHTPEELFASVVQGRIF
jgi:hypothetical protein